MENEKTIKKIKGRPRKFDKQQALDAALKLFWNHGYDNTSVAQLSDAMGIKPASIYAAFGSKEELFMAVVERYGELNGGLYAQSLVKPSAREVAESILTGEVELVTRKDWPDGCLVVQGALTTTPDSENIRQFMNGVRNIPVGWMRDRFVRAQEEGDLPPDADPETLAVYIMTVNCGLAVMARSGASREQLEQVVVQAMQSWPVSSSEK